mmetsp:Transcript_107500/g.321505  ORF Transcript_107500/g.321505 Transcript_107500/m.321505 type:complete len:285 (+) Transcript_107500:958-1812(+)
MFFAVKALASAEASGQPPKATVRGSRSNATPRRPPRKLPSEPRAKAANRRRVLRPRTSSRLQESSSSGVARASTSCCKRRNVLGVTANTCAATTPVAIAQTGPLRARPTAVRWPSRAPRVAQTAIEAPPTRSPSSRPAAQRTARARRRGGVLVPRWATAASPPCAWLAAAAARAPLPARQPLRSGAGLRHGAACLALALCTTAAAAIAPSALGLGPAEGQLQPPAKQSSPGGKARAAAAATLLARRPLPRADTRATPAAPHPTGDEDTEVRTSTFIPIRQSGTR